MPLMKAKLPGHWTQLAVPVLRLREPTWCVLTFDIQTTSIMTFDIQTTSIGNRPTWQQCKPLDYVHRQEPQKMPSMTS